MKLNVNILNIYFLFYIQYLLAGHLYKLSACLDRYICALIQRTCVLQDTQIMRIVDCMEVIILPTRAQGAMQIF